MVALGVPASSSATSLPLPSFQLSVRVASGSTLPAESRTVSVRSNRPFSSIGKENRSRVLVVALTAKNCQRLPVLVWLGRIIASNRSPSMSQSIGSSIVGSMNGTPSGEV